MRINGYSLQSGLMALALYMGLVFTLVYYFNTRQTEKPKHFVMKNDESIRVSLSSASSSASSSRNVAKKSVSKPIAKPRIVKKPTPKKPIPKKPTPPKPIPKKVIEKVVPKKVIEKIIPKKVVEKVVPKKVIPQKPTPQKHVMTTKELMASLETGQKPSSKTTPSLTKSKAGQTTSNHSTKAPPLDKGIANAYFAKVEDKLKGWPAQSEYAGEKAEVYLEIEPTGSFTFRVISASGNREFNEGLKAYLTQLQMFGFGRHQGGRAYELHVEFIANE